MLEVIIDNNGIDPLVDIPGAEAALAAIDGGDLKIWYVHTTLSEAAATRDEERRTRLLLALAGLGKLVQSSVTAAPNGPKGGAMPRSHCATRRTGALYPARFLHDWGLEEAAEVAVRVS